MSDNSLRIEVLKAMGWRFECEDHQGPCAGFFDWFVYKPNGYFYKDRTKPTKDLGTMLEKWSSPPWSPKGNWVEPYPIPDPTTDIGEAMELLEEIRDNGWGIYIECQPAAAGWYVLLEHPTDIDKVFDYTADEESLNVSICRAYLKAKEIINEQSSERNAGA